MPRTMLSKRTSDTIDLHLGKVLIFCEGHTEENYFSFFQKRIKNKYDDIIIVMENVNANSQSVLNYAVRFMQNEDNHNSYYNYDKYLVFDCDAPDNILEVLDEAQGAEYGFHLLISSLLFEVWLLMHLEELEAKPINKIKIAQKLETQLRLPPDSYEKHKNDPGLIASIIKEYRNVENAIMNAGKLRQYYSDHNIEIEAIISKHLPYCTVDELVIQLAKATE